MGQECFRRSVDARVYSSNWDSPLCSFISSYLSDHSFVKRLNCRGALAAAHPLKPCSLESDPRSPPKLRQKLTPTSAAVPKLTRSQRCRPGQERSREKGHRRRRRRTSRKHQSANESANGHRQFVLLTWRLMNHLPQPYPPPSSLPQHSQSPPETPR